jgi:hypothetical protein
VLLFCDVTRLAPLLPILFPLSKKQHGAVQHTPAMQRLELLLHLTMRSLYKQHPMPAPAGMRVDAQASATSDSTAQKVQSFLASYAAHHSSPKTHGDSTDAAVTAALAALEAGGLPQRVSNFPFVPLGVAADNIDHDLWLNNEGMLMLPFVTGSYA